MASKTDMKEQIELKIDTTPAEPGSSGKQDGDAPQLNFSTDGDKKEESDTPQLNFSSDTDKK